MQIPTSSTTGKPTVSTTQLRAYGAGEISLASGETERGCPRQYKAKYVDKDAPPTHRSFPLVYGSYVHDVLYRMEEDGLTPDEALVQCLPPELGPEHMEEARQDIESYMQRGASPTDLYGTVGVEKDLAALLYVDEEYGEIWFRGIIDWMGVDLDNPDILHFADYKTNRTPPSRDQVRRDHQLKAYHWLVQQHVDTYGARRVVAHLDAIKWHDIEVPFTDMEIEEWRTWAEAICRQILRDEDAKPKLNPACDWCPVKETCPAYVALPKSAQALAGGVTELTDPAQRLRWRDAANKVRLLLEKQVKEIDKGFADEAERAGRLTVGNTAWDIETDWRDQIDLHQLHDVLGERFYRVVTASKTSIGRETKNDGTDMVAAVQACIERVPVGTKITKKEKKDG